MDALIDRLYWIASDPALSRASADDIRRAALALAKTSGTTKPQAVAPGPVGGELPPLPRPAVLHDADDDGA
jgi:hypothetical protein